MQSDVDICTDESKLVINRGPLNLRKDVRELALASVKYIMTDVNDIRKRYFSLGFHLSEMQHLKYYEDFGFDSLEEFCSVNIGLDKSAVSRCINVFRRFSKISYVHGNIIPSRLNCIGDKWKDYSYSQLCEMVSMSDDLCEKVSPDMSVKKIRELKKNRGVPVATSQPEKKESNILSVVDLSVLKGAAKMKKVSSVDSVGKIELSIYSSSGRCILDFSGDVLLTGDKDCVTKTMVVRLDSSSSSFFIDSLSGNVKEG